MILFKGVCEVLGMPLHSQCDGTIERFKKTSEKHFSKAVSPAPSADVLDDIRHWQAPSRLFLGKEIILPYDLTFEVEYTTVKLLC